MRHRSELMLVWPLTILALAAMVVLGVSLTLGARQVDAKVRRHEEQLVRRAMDGQIHGFENNLIRKVAQDDAVAHLDNRMDPEWAQRVLPLPPEVGKLDYLVVDGRDQPQWMSHHTTLAPTSEWADLTRQAWPVIAELRDLEARRGSWVKGDPVRSKPIAITRLEQRDGKGYMWVAALVDPDNGSVRSKDQRSSIVLNGGFVGPASIAAIQARYGLENARIVTDPSRVRADQARAPLNMARGAAPTVLVWTPQTPSRDLLAGSIWIVLSTVVALVALSVMMFRRTRKAAHDLVEVHRAQREFLANMSHEIRTPLNGVNALADALTKSDLTVRQREMAETIRSSGVMLERLLTDLLDLARIDAVSMDLETEPFNLSVAANSAVALMSARARDRGLDLRVQIDPAANRMVLGDVTRLKQILTNLISNAIKFTDQGHITLRVGPALSPDSWRMSVEDTGIGFDPAMKAKLFQRFHQVDGSVTRRFGGSGLGLAISRGLAVKMGGSLDAEGEPGAGAIFTLEVPLPPAPSRAEPASVRTVAPPEPAPQEHLPPRGPRVLLSEDHPVNRMVFEMQLADIGADIVSTENGLEALEAFETQAFDVVLMDMQMPVMDGLTAIRRMRERERARRLTRTPIIMVTANALPEHRASAMAVGADLFLTKPVDAEDLNDALRRLHAAAVA